MPVRPDSTIVCASGKLACVGWGRRVSAGQCSGTAMPPVTAGCWNCLQDVKCSMAPLSIQQQATVVPAELGLLTWAASMRKRASASGPEPLRGAGAGATTCRGILAPASIIHIVSLGMKGVRAWHSISRWHTASEARHRLQERVTCTTGMPTWTQTPSKHEPPKSPTCPYRLPWVRLCQPSAALSNNRRV